MAEVIIPAIPRDGGTVSMNGANSHVVRLTNNRFLSLFQQTGPNYFIGSLFEVTDPVTTSPSVNLIRQQIITGLPDMYYSPSGQTFLRAWRLNDNATLLLYNTSSGPSYYKVAVIEADPVTNNLSVTTTSDTSLGNLNIYAFYPFVNNDSILLGAGCQLDENIVTFALKNSSSAGVAYIYRWTYNPTTKSLSLTINNSTLLNTTRDNSYYRAYSVTKVPNSATAIFKLVTDSSTGTGGFTRAGFISNGNGHLAKVTATNMDPVELTGPGPVNSSSYKNYIPFTDTSGVILENSGTSRYINNWSVNQSSSQFSSNYQTYGIPVDGFAFNDSYYCILSTSNTTTTDMQPITGTRYFRVVKHTDPYYSQTAPGTAGSGGISTNSVAGVAVNFYRYFIDQPILDRATDNLIYICGLNSATEFKIQSLWV